MTEPRIAGRELDAEVAERGFGYGWRAGHTPPFSSDIAAAFQVVERMIADGWRVYIDGPRFHDREWRVMFAKDRTTTWAHAETLPLAICRAALDAVPAAGCGCVSCQPDAPTHTGPCCNPDCCPPSGGQSPEEPRQ